MSDGSAIPLSSASTLTVVPNRAAIPDRVSPNFTRYVADGDGDAAGEGASDRLGDGVAVGRGVALGAELGDATGLGAGLDVARAAEGDGEVPATGDPVAGRRATTTAPRATAMSATRPIWVSARSRAMDTTASNGPPRSITTGAVRGIGHRPGTSRPPAEAATASRAAM